MNVRWVFEEDIPANYFKPNIIQSHWLKVCLDPPVHPVSLPCGHIFCYLCAKVLPKKNMVELYSPPSKQGLGAGLGASKLCSLCRRPIPHGFLESAEVLSKVKQTAELDFFSYLDNYNPIEQASQELNDTPPVDATEQQWQWFYEGR